MSTRRSNEVSRHEAATTPWLPGCAGHARGRRAPLAALTAILTALWLAPPAALAQVSFSGPDRFGAGDGPVALAVDDFDGDSEPDLAAANVSSDNVSVLLGNGDGSFGAASNFTAGDGPRSVVASDLDGDSDADLAFANAFSDGVSVLLDNGDGTFGAATRFGAGDAPQSLAVGDVDGDSDPDLAVANFNSDTVAVLLGNGAGSFSTATQFAAGNGPNSVAVGHLNGDSDLDLAVVNAVSGTVSVLPGNGAGSFGAGTQFAVGTEPRSVAVADLDGDSDPDLAVANEGSNDVSVLLGNGAGSFGAASRFAAGNGPRSVAVDDLDGDSDPDLAVANVNSDNVSVMLGNGAGSFGAATNLTAGDAPQSVIVSDLDGDADTDLAVASFFSDSVFVLRNNRPPSARDDRYSTAEDTPLNVGAPGVLGNDADPDGDRVTAVSATQPAHGTVASNGDGSFTYTPAINYNGEDAFTYTVSDGSRSDVAIVSVTVTPVDDAPTATNLSASETYFDGTALDLTDIVAADVDSAGVTATLALSTPLAGSLTTATARSATSTYNATTGVWTAAGAIADVNALLAGVRFVPAAGFTSDFTIATSVSDGSGAATGTKAVARGVTPAISVAGASLREGDTGSAPMTFTLALSVAAPRPVAVEVTTSDRSAVAGSDYTAVSTTVSIPAGATSATVAVPVRGDAQMEPDESFAVSLANPVNATLGHSTTAGTIVNDDVGIAVTSPNGGESWTGDSTVDITWSWAGPLSGKVALDLYKGGVFVKKIANNVALGASGQGSYSWSIPAKTATGSDYTVRLSVGRDAFVDVSDRPFTIVIGK